MTVHFVYITASTKEEALRIGRQLVNERLAACVNILDGMTSIYRWEGNMEESSEAVLIAKTSVDRVSRLTDRVRELHSYSLPCIVAWPVPAGNPPYLDWIRKETR